ncbi:aminotransferase [Emericellopsis atlantica]|uniref:Aminotransferase n=1 Tax=Emericellopsis atlantica TaxID=2614577 RepID=A0A9P7ZV93_9HYPO|nr:aminotransferase [Emericellopsis atlantica]KAG9258288.1 aminotransferase [Emericellopsis atlantica]
MRVEETNTRFPPPPREGVDWSTQSADTFTHSHVESRRCAATGEWSQPVLVEDPYLRVHGLAPVFHYGQEAYEGLKAFRTPHNEIRIVRPDYHARRFRQSAELVSIPPVPQDIFLRSVEMAVAHNAEFVPPNDEESMLYIRPVVFGTGGSMQLKPSDEYLFCVYVTCAGAFYGSEALDCLILEDFDRAAPRGTGSGKVGGNYSPVMRWSRQAKERGFDITLHLDSQTRSEVEEFTTSAFLGIRVQEGGTPTLVAPDTKNVVDSVTSDCARRIARDLGWAVQRRPVKYTELEHFSEIMACGTAVALVGIRSITRESTNEVLRYSDRNGELGPYTKILQEHLCDIHKGRAADRFGWMHKVPPPEKAADRQIDRPGAH